MNYKPLSKKEESIAGKIVDSAYSVHKILGHGLLEKVYEACLCHELSKRGLKYRRQVDVPIVYDGIIFDEGLRLKESFYSFWCLCVLVTKQFIMFGALMHLWRSNL